MAKGSQKALTKVTFKPSTQSTDEFTIIVNAEEFKQYQNEPSSVRVLDVVDSTDVFFSNQGSQGILGKPSKQQLENVFGTTNEMEIIQQILEKGKSQAGDGIRNGSGVAATNMTFGSAVVDTKGKGLRGV
ncbi:SBDS domain-containing protein [Phanerochaete sordida]|uniref:SBDS domain-containing protein n=1 Tax=Phanerochaete sordida TaxID=48140 RepID=A0A9P3FX77_9APHY|nr:SBDS domain-containing protein [Phanerochaete sordida]